MSIQIKKIDSSMEKKIITGMIVSKGYLRDVQGCVDIAYFQNSYTKKVAVWCLEYYEQYQQAPFATMDDVFGAKEPTLSEEEREIVRNLLTDISNHYSQLTSINEEYLFDQTIRYFKRRELEIVKNNLSVLLDQDKVEEAEKEITTFRNPSKIPVAWANPLNEESVNEVFRDHDRGFFRFPGRLGDFCGNFERGWLVGFIGPFKRGKTWWLQEVAIMAVLSGLRVAFISLEMKRERMHNRIYMRLVGAPKEGTLITYPVFDCVLNQSGECNLPQRTSNVPLFDSRGRRPSTFNPSSPYVPCTSCRGTNQYELDTWWEQAERPTFDEAHVYSRMEAMRKRYGNSFRTISYPRFSANTQDILRDLDILEAKEGFIPDVIIPDYADILKNESSSTVDVVDETWKNLARIAGERKAMVVTASQGTREGTEVETLRQKHMALWIGKLAHVDVMYSLNQTDDEKEKGVMRVGMLGHRHEEFIQGRTCTVLQNLELGQVHLDSELTPPKRREE